MLALVEQTGGTKPIYENVPRLCCLSKQGCPRRRQGHSEVRKTIPRCSSLFLPSWLLPKWRKSALRFWNAVRILDLKATRSSIEARRTPVLQSLPIGPCWRCLRRASVVPASSWRICSLEAFSTSLARTARDASDLVFSQRLSAVRAQNAIFWGYARLHATQLWGV